MESKDRVLSELLKLNGRLDSHEAKVLARLDAQDDALADIRRDIKGTNILVSGNGEPAKGLVVRVDRLEQDDKRRSTYMRSCIVACISAIVGTVFLLFKHLVGKP